LFLKSILGQLVSELWSRKRKWPSQPARKPGVMRHFDVFSLDLPSGHTYRWFNCDPQGQEHLNDAAFQVIW